MFLQNNMRNIYLVLVKIMIPTLEGNNRVFKKNSTTSVTKKLRVLAKHFGLSTDRKHTFHLFGLSGTEIQADKRTDGYANTRCSRVYVPIRLGHKNLQFPLSLLKVGSVGTR